MYLMIDFEPNYDANIVSDELLCFHFSFLL